MNNKPTEYDLLVIYSSPIARSAGNKQYKEKAPFSSKSRQKGYNDSYSYFLSRCKKLGIKAAFATSNNIIAPGTVKSFWIYDNKWIRDYEETHANVIFDKFTPSTYKQEKKLKLLTSSKKVYLFNNKKISAIFSDKLNTHRHFKDFTIPTVKITQPLKQDIQKAKTKLDNLLKKHKSKLDFVNGHIIKDNTGAGGFKIHKIDFNNSGNKKIIKHHKTNKKIKELLDYILQPFVDCSGGFKFGKHKGLIDLRIILLNHKLIQTYIRIAKKGKFRCNEHQGGDLVYLPLTSIPKEVLVMVKKIVKKLDTKANLKHSLYALDFMRSNNGNLYFIEGNTNPGIDWNPKNKINEKKSKELIDIIVRELKLIVHEKNRI